MDKQVLENRLAAHIQIREQLQIRLAAVSGEKAQLEDMIVARSGAIEEITFWIQQLDTPAGGNHTPEESKVLPLKKEEKV